LLLIGCQGPHLWQPFIGMADMGNVIITRIGYSHDDMNCSSNVQDFPASILKKSISGE